MQHAADLPADSASAPDSVPAEGYVTRAGWLTAAGRPDLIDEIADTVERPAA